MRVHNKLDQETYDFLVKMHWSRDVDVDFWTYSKLSATIFLNSSPEIQRAAIERNYMTETTFRVCVTPFTLFLFVHLDLSVAMIGAPIRSN